MTKDGVREATGRKLQRYWDHVLNEPIPFDMLQLIDKLRSVR